MSTAETKRCVYCGGYDHPTECGLPNVTPTPWIALALAICLPVYALVALVWQLV